MQGRAAGSQDRPRALAEREMKAGEGASVGVKRVTLLRLRGRSPRGSGAAGAGLGGSRSWSGAQAEVTRGRRAG